MALVRAAIDENEEFFTLESQNIPRCFHDQQITDNVKAASQGIHIDLEKLTNIVQYHLNHQFLIAFFIPAEHLSGKSYSS